MFGSNPDIKNYVWIVGSDLKQFTLHDYFQ